jgi:hypothetical protein
MFQIGESILAVVCVKPGELVGLERPGAGTRNSVGVGASSSLWPFRSDINVISLSLEEVPRKDKKAEKRHARIALDKQAGTRILTIQFGHGYQ